MSNEFYAQQYYNPMYNNYGYNNGYIPQPVQLPKFNDPLTPEQSQLLGNKTSDLSIVISDLEKAKSICPHRDLQNSQYGNPVIKWRISPVDPSNLDRVKCDKCGEEFNLINPKDGDIRQIELACTMIIDILQSMKTQWLDVPTEFAQNYFPIIPLIRRLPTIYKHASKNFSKFGMINNYRSQGHQDGFSILNSMIGTMPYVNAYGYQQPYGYGPQMQQPYGYAPQQMPVFAQANPQMPTMFGPNGNFAQPMQPQAQAPNQVMMPQGTVAPTYQQPTVEQSNPFGYYGAAPAQPMPQQPIYPNQAMGPVVPQPIPSQAPTINQVQMPQMTQPVDQAKQAPLNTPSAVPTGDTVNEKIYNV